MLLKNIIFLMVKLNMLYCSYICSSLDFKGTICTFYYTYFTFAAIFFIKFRRQDMIACLVIEIPPYNSI